MEFIASIDQGRSNHPQWMMRISLRIAKKMEQGSLFHPYFQMWVFTVFASMRSWMKLIRVERSNAAWKKKISDLFQSIHLSYKVYSSKKKKTLFWILIELTSCSPAQTCWRFSGGTMRRLQRACSNSKSLFTKGTWNPWAHRLYSFTSQITHMAPTTV